MIAIPLPFRSIHEITSRIVQVSETTNDEKSFVTLRSIKRLCGNPDHGSPGGHILCYHRPGANGNFVTNFQVLQDSGPGPNQATRAHLHPAGHVNAGIEHATVGDARVVSVGAVQVEEVERTHLDVGRKDIPRAKNISATKRYSRHVAY